MLSYLNFVLKKNHSSIFEAIENEYHRQFNQIELIASENIASKAVMAVQGSVLTNKYAEGYPGRRYYGGCEYVDVIETIAIDRIKELFGCAFANVQPHSGSQANQSVMLALLKPGDTILGMSLSAGGHLTHGSSVNLSGKWFNAVGYGVASDTCLIDYEDVQRIALESKPKLIIAGGSSYSRIIDFSQFRKIANEVGAYLVVDMAHFAGLVAGGVYPSPLPYADVVTSTTHKTLRGPRGGLVLTNREEIARKVDSALFPGLQGGPLMHVIGAKAVCFGEALEPSFKSYAENIIANAQCMARVFEDRGYPVITRGTDSHLFVINTYNQGVTGKEACIALERAHITCNKNAVPFDKLSPQITSGIRLGTPFCTTRGMRKDAFEKIAHWIADILDAQKSSHLEEITQKVKSHVLELCDDYPLYV